MQLQIQGTKCKKYIPPSSYRKRSVHISLFIGQRPSSSKPDRPKSSVVSYIQRRLMTPSVKEDNADSCVSPIYMPKLLSKTPSPQKLRFYSNKFKTPKYSDQSVPAEAALKKLTMKNSSMTQALNLSINIGKFHSMTDKRSSTLSNNPVLKIVSLIH